MLDNALLGLTHEQQQEAVEKIQQLMAEGDEFRRSHCICGTRITTKTTKIK